MFIYFITILDSPLEIEGGRAARKREERIFCIFVLKYNRPIEKCTGHTWAACGIFTNQHTWKTTPRAKGQNTTRNLGSSQMNTQGRTTALSWNDRNQKQCKWPPRGNSFNKCGELQWKTSSCDNHQRAMRKRKSGKWRKVARQLGPIFVKRKHKEYINMHTALYVPTYNCFPCVPDKFQETVLGDVSKMVKY